MCCDIRQRAAGLYQRYCRVVVRRLEASASTANRTDGEALTVSYDRFGAPLPMPTSSARRIDMWREVQALVEGVVGATRSELGVQDGREAGQSVPHVHVHVLPRQGS